MIGETTLLSSTGNTCKGVVNTAVESDGSTEATVRLYTAKTVTSAGDTLHLLLAIWF